MAWRDNLRPGSFRGVAFKTDSAGTEGGRRLAVHEYPKRDRPYVEDMGRKVKRHSFTAYVIGTDYMTARDALKAALDQEGPGALVHPYLADDLQVAIDSYRTSETRDEGGKCAFDITYIEAGGNTYPAPSADTAAGVLSAASANSAAASASFAERYQWLALPDYIIDSATTALQDLSAAVAGLRSIPNQLIGAATDAVTGLYDDAADLARSTDIPATIGDVLSLYRQGQSDAAVAQSGLRSLMDFSAVMPSIYVPTANRTTQIENLTAIGDLVQSLAVTEQAKATLAQSYVSYDDAVAARDAMSDDLDTVITAAGDRGDDGMFQAASDLKTAVVVDLTARGASLARIVYRQYGKPMNSLVLAQRIYQDSSRNLEIAARNATPHPGFLPVTVEALSR